MRMENISPFRMSSSVPTPLPPATQDATAQGAAQLDASTDARALAADAQSTPTQAVPAMKVLGQHAGNLLAKPVNAVFLLAAVTWGVLHFLTGKYPPSKLKLFAAGGFGALVYGSAALRDKDPLVALKGLKIIANDATASSNLSLTKRLLAAWYVTFPAIAIAAAFVKQLTPLTMVAVAGVIMLLPMILMKQGIAL